MDRKRIQCWSNASQHIPIYLQRFTSYSEIFFGKYNFILPLAFNAPVVGVPIGIPGNSLDLRKLESWDYQAVKRQFDERLSRFDTIPACDRRTDRRMDVQPIAITCVSLLTHVKKHRGANTQPCLTSFVILKDRRTYHSLLWSSTRARILVWNELLTLGRRNFSGQLNFFFRICQSFTYGWLNHKP